MVAEFEADLIWLPTRKGMKVAQSKGRLRGRQPKLTINQAKHLLELDDLGIHVRAQLTELFNVGRSIIYRTLHRVRPGTGRARAPVRSPDDRPNSRTTTRLTGVRLHPARVNRAQQVPKAERRLGWR
jgi:hypothetical protein